MAERELSQLVALTLLVSILAGVITPSSGKKYEKTDDHKEQNGISKRSFRGFRSVPLDKIGGGVVLRELEEEEPIKNLNEINQTGNSKNKGNTPDKLNSNVRLLAYQRNANGQNLNKEGKGKITNLHKLRKRNFDEIDRFGFNSIGKKSFDEIDKAGFNGFGKRNFDEIDRAGFRVMGKKNFDEIDRSGFSNMGKRNFDEIDRAGFSNMGKRNFDEIDRSGFHGLGKRNFDEIDRSGFHGLGKRNFDEIDRSGFHSLGKRNFDEIDRSGFGSMRKRNFDEIDRSGFANIGKRHFYSLDNNPFVANPNVDAFSFNNIDKSLQRGEIKNIGSDREMMLRNSLDLNTNDKRNFDEIDRSSFNSIGKKNFDEIDKSGFSSFGKRNFDEIDRSGFGNMGKRNANLAAKEDSNISNQSHSNDGGGLGIPSLYRAAIGSLLKTEKSKESSPVSESKAH